MEPTDPPPEHGSGESPQHAEPELRCPRCNAQHEPGQEYCLECGLRLVPLPPVYRRMEVWSRDSPVWLWAALGALLLVALVAGAIVAAAAAGGDDEATPASEPGTSTVGGLPTGPATITLGTTTSPTTPTTVTLPTTTGPTTVTLPTTTAPTTGSTPTTTGPSGTISWPSGTDGYTVILQSVPTSEGRGKADATAAEAIRSGLPEVGVLDSTDYDSLNSGYWVVFTGVYDTLNEAENALPRARNAGYSLAYVRQVANVPG